MALYSISARRHSRIIDLKGMASLKMYRDIEIPKQKRAWLLAHKIQYNHNPHTKFLQSPHFGKTEKSSSTTIFQVVYLIKSFLLFLL